VATKSLPDSDPLKGFVGFGASFGGKWFGGYAQGEGRNHAEESARNIRAQFQVLRSCAGVRFELRDFLAVPPDPGFPMCIYADPPYMNTTGYNGVPRFDGNAFWARCQEWAVSGVRVFVSEFECPVPHTILWEKERPLSVAKEGPTVRRMERLFEVLPVTVSAVA
jgi:DNA adenine methylase